MKQKLKEKKGMTMINVLAAFAVLTLVLLMFGQAVNVSMNMYIRAEDLRKSAETLYSEFYETSLYNATGTGGTPITLNFQRTDGVGSGFAIKQTTQSFSNAQGTIHYFGARKGVTPP